MSKKMKIDDIKQGVSDKNQALQDLKKAQADADKQLEAMGTEHEFEIKGECLDKNGNKTKVLVIDTDKEGYIGMFLSLGNPYSVNGDGEQKEDSDKLVKYFHFMSNIDLKDTANQKAVGIKAISKARSVVGNFFMLSLVSGFHVGEETAE